MRYRARGNEVTARFIATMTGRAPDDVQADEMDEDSRKMTLKFNMRNQCARLQWNAGSDAAQ